MANYQLVTSKVAGSSYYLSTWFSYYQISWVTGDVVQTSYHTDPWSSISGDVIRLKKSRIESLYMWQTPASAINLRMKSYGQGCSILSWELLMMTGSMMIRLAPISGPKRYCMSIDLLTCRIKDVSCPKF
jgi:hypothetical protein